MTRSEAIDVAAGAVYMLPHEARVRLKAVDVVPRLHQGMLTVRLYFRNVTAEDPESYTFKAEEVLPPYPGVHDR